MPVRVGNTAIASLGKIKLGTTNITKVFRGSVQIWPSGFSSTITVGNNSNQYGYRFSLFGAITNADISNPAGANAVLTDLFFQNGTLAFYIQNNSIVTEPNGWTTLNIGGTNYNRTSFSVSYNAPIGRWIYTLSTGTNPFGTTVGATRTITLN
jgi:hypothetical protein